MANFDEKHKSVISGVRTIIWAKNFLHQMAIRKFEITFLGKSSQFFAENSCQLYIWAIYDMENVTKLCFNPI